MSFNEAMQPKGETPTAQAKLGELWVEFAKMLSGEQAVLQEGLKNPETQGSAVTVLMGLLSAFWSGDKTEDGKKDKKERSGKVKVIELIAEVPKKEPKPSVPAEIPPGPPRTTDEQLDRAEVPLQQGKRSGQGTEALPYHSLFIPEGIANGGCLGYVDGHGDFDPALAKAQIRHLVSKKGVRTIVSLVEGNRIAPIVGQLLTEGLNVEHIATTINTNQSALTDRNRQLFERLANMQNVFVHCRHGTHRAVTATVGAILARGESRSFGAAFKEAGGNLDNFRGRDYALPMLSQAIEYAQTHHPPIEVEPEYLRAVEGLRANAPV